MNDPAPVRLSRTERRTKRMTGLVTPSTKANWEAMQAESPMSVGDLIAWAVELLKTHPELKEKK